MLEWHTPPFAQICCLVLSHVTEIFGGTPIAGFCVTLRVTRQSAHRKRDAYISPAEGDARPKG